MAAARLQVDQPGILGGDEELADMGAGNAEPVPDVRGRVQEAQASVVVGRDHVQETDLAQAGDEMVDLTCARAQSGRDELLLQAPDGEPCLAAGRILAGVEDDSQVIDEKTARLDQQPHQKRIVAVDPEKAIKIELAGIREARILEDVLEGHVRRPSHQLPDFRIVQSGPTPDLSPTRKLLARQTPRNPFQYRPTPAPSGVDRAESR